MKFSLWTQYGARNSRPVFDAFRRSIIDSGHTVLENSLSGDVDVIWSVLWNGRMAPNQRIFNTGKPTIVLEVGAIKRGITWKVGYNGIARHNIISSSCTSETRAKDLGLPFKPWRSDGEHILICCQNPKSHLWANLPTPSDWITQTVNTIRMHSNRHIIVRPHPRAPLRCQLPTSKNISYQIPSKIPASYDDYNLSFTKAHAVINPNSNPGPQAVLNGVPAFVNDSSLAYNVSNTDLSMIENPRKPVRTQWLDTYARSEHTLDEIKQGIPLSKLLIILDF